MSQPKGTTPEITPRQVSMVLSKARQRLISHILLLLGSRVGGGGRDTGQRSSLEGRRRGLHPNLGSCTNLLCFLGWCQKFWA